MTLYDLTPRITPALAVWPGDTPPSREVLLDLARGDTVTLSTLRATVHLGAHADAPSHYDPQGVDIAARPLELYLGPCDVIHPAPAPAPGTRVRLDMLPPAGREGRAPRVLIATGTMADPEEWSRFAALDPALIAHLAAEGVRLIGIDTPSVDLADSKDLPAHRMAARHDLAILEGLMLSHVPPGRYELIALPLPLVGFDASPVRAVLRG